MKKILSIALTTFIVGGSLPIKMGHANEGTDLGKVVVFKTPWCGCCQVWVDALRKAGYRVEANDLNDLSAIRKQAGVPSGKEGCHTAVIGTERKYVLEGHVPLQAIEKLTAEKPNIRGIATPGMPMGSLGMGYDPKAKYTVFAFGNGTQPAPFYEAGQL